VSAQQSLELSVVIATHNRWELLARCVEALRRQTQDAASFEVIVVDDGSTDRGGDVLDRLDTPFGLRVLRQGRVGRAAAHNAGIQAAEGAVCLIIDDDVIPGPDLIAEHLAAHESGERVLGIGKLTQTPPRARDWYAHAFARAWNRHCEALDGRSLDWTDCYGGNLSAPRSALIEVGGFSAADLAVGQDVELAFRLCRQGWVPRYLPRAQGVHDDQKRRRELLEDSRLQGAAHVELAEREPAMLPRLLGWFGATTGREVLLRRLLLALRVPPVLLAAVGPLVPGGGRRQIWHDFVRRFAFWRAVRRCTSRARWVQITHGVPVLMYHAFCRGRTSDRYIVSRRTFAMQMWLLAILRYRVVAFEDLARALRECRLPPRRAAVITIDDGYADNLDIAHPILRRRGFAATIFLVSGRLGARNDWAGGSLGGRRLLSRQETMRLRADGVRFGAHTRSHRPLPELDEEEAIGEIRGSREDLEWALGTTVRAFAYPQGRHDERAVEAVERAGFLGAGTAEPRLCRLDDDPSLIPRLEIRSSDSAVRYLRKLWFGGA
jgi:GT2 family glycosyltransferase/peptidoglycan/xylan/chitin deacetylase (PgdA/CDA1 family)